MSTKPLLPQRNRYDFIRLPERKDYSWPGGSAHARGTAALPRRE